MSIDDLIYKYVTLHNDGVRRGRFEPIVELFADDAEFCFEFGTLGTLKGKEEILAAFKKYPPTDELLLVNVHQSGTRVSAIYAWQSEPGRLSGVLEMEIEFGLIQRLTAGTIK